MVRGSGQSTGNPYWTQQSLTKHSMRSEILCGPFCPHVLIIWQKAAGVVKEKSVWLRRSLGKAGTQTRDQEAGLKMGAMLPLRLSS